MDLKFVEQQFNQIFNIDQLKEYAENQIKEMISQSEDNYLSDDEFKLEDGLKISDLIVEYRKFTLHVNNFDREYPFMRIHIDLLHPKTFFQIFYYEIELNNDGEVSDDYFGRY
ncbi:hypothetical protein ACFO9Q_05465 [Paenibacillus sp. GCM10023252]|uniref:hypothetical protein n=1 Tax=Paenibacillus sp. GCM10023252 TaxID=3252649 RepID=UPI00361614F6